MSQIDRPQTFPALVDKTVVITGPTASGKSSLAIKLAEQIGGEILSLDSIAVYRKMDIGTAKPTPDDQSRVPHHLIDLADPDCDFSVARYLVEAHRRVEDVMARGKWPILVGGTPMYLKAILRGFDPGPPADWGFRESVQRDIDTFGVEALRQRLLQVDPLSASKIGPGDIRRMIRALEVAKLTGKPLSHRQIQFDRETDSGRCAVFWLRHPRSRLHQRINQRVTQMFADGLINEVNLLIDQYGTLSRTASQAVGYRELIKGIRDRTPVEVMMAEVATHTRQLAKRQETWFRSFKEITHLEIDEATEMNNLLGQIKRQIDACKC